jgi:hypothetical protein
VRSSPLYNRAAEMARRKGGEWSWANMDNA